MGCKETEEVQDDKVSFRGGRRCLQEPRHGVTQNSVRPVWRRKLKMTPMARQEKRSERDRSFGKDFEEGVRERGSRDMGATGKRKGRNPRPQMKMVSKSVHRLQVLIL